MRGSWCLNRRRRRAAGGAAVASKVFLRDTCFGDTAPDGCVPSTTAVAALASGGADKNQAYSPFISANGRYISFVEGRSTFAVPSESSTEGALVVRDTCFGAALPCNPRAYAFSAAATVGAVSALKTAVVPVNRAGRKSLRSAWTNIPRRRSVPTGAMPRSTLPPRLRRNPPAAWATCIFPSHCSSAREAESPTARM